MRSHLNTVIDSLALDHLRGASEIVENAAQLFREISKLAKSNPGSAEQLFERAVKRLATGQPSMASVLNLTNMVCIIKEKSLDSWESFGFELNAYLLELKERSAQIVEISKKLPRHGKTLMTYSNSSTVVKSITHCHKEFGWPKRVVCSEGRPMMEGLNMARKLRNAGLEVTLYTDAALLSQILSVDMVWVGGDSFHKNGLVNKVGSAALALLAMISHKPFISLMTTDKLLSTGMLDFFRFIPQNPREIVEEEIIGIEVVNEYYETIPSEFISFIFTEDGLQKPEKLIKNIDNQPVSSLFREIVQKAS